MALHQENSLSLSKRLAMELIGWYESLMEAGESPPNAFTGVCGNGKQFVCLLTPLSLNPNDRLDFMSEVLKAELCKAFAHSTRVMREDGVECIDIYSGEDGEYWVHCILLKPEGPVLEQYGPENKPTIFFQEILSAKRPISPSKDRLLTIWANVKDKIMWR